MIVRCTDAAAERREKRKAKRANVGNAGDVRNNVGIRRAHNTHPRPTQPGEKPIYAAVAAAFDRLIVAEFSLNRHVTIGEPRA